MNDTAVGIRTLDTVLHLLDRQVLDSEGLMVCKVDDVEVSESADGRLTVTGILVGPAALLPRYSGRSGRGVLRWWRLLGLQQHDRDRPWRIEWDHVETVSSALHLRVGREEVMSRTGGPAERSTHRISDLLGMEVWAGGALVGPVMDVRLQRRGVSTYDCVAVLVGKARPGSMLGYDRREAMGPAWLNGAVRWLMRHSCQVDLGSDLTIEWQARRITVSTSPKPVESI